MPTLVVQGGRDPFGRPAEFPPGTTLAEVVHGDHGFAVPKSAGIGEAESMAGLTDAVTGWLDGMFG